MRDTLQQQSGHRGYRQRDRYGSDRDRTDNSRNDRDYGRPQFNDFDDEHGIPDYFYDDPLTEAHQSTRPPSDRGRGRGRGREPRNYRQQPSNSRHNPVPPPAPRPSKANEDKKKSNIKGAPKNARPKTMPQANRNKCGACSEDHDIRYCPYPNTEDGRTKICPICNTTKHAWFECWYYKRDVLEQWTVCWENRRCLPALVHDAPLDEIFHSRVSLARETSNKDGPFPFKNFNSLPGPLSPAFVKRLMPLDVGDAHIQHELQEGRISPWELTRGMLEDSSGCTVRAIRDQSTMEMRIDRFIDGTRSSAGSVPTASKQDFFHDMDNVIKANDNVYNQILAKKPLPSLKAIIPSPCRVFGTRPFTDEMMDSCENCGTKGHRILDCPGHCKECGKKMQHHMGSLIGVQCKRGCVCCDDPGHTKVDCNRLCRPCIIEDRNSNTQLKDCKKHCPLHMCLTSDGWNHSGCFDNHKACPTCNQRHWYQDCPQWLGTLCVRQDCLAKQCNAHCRMCGGQNIDEIMSFFANNDNVAYRQQVQSLVQTWHQYLDNSQWERISVPNADIKYSTWSALRCKRLHGRVKADARTLEQLRVATWKAVANCVRGGFTEETITEAERLLRIPECRACFDQKYEAGTADFDTRTPGIENFGGCVY